MPIQFQYQFSTASKSEASVEGINIFIQRRLSILLTRCRLNSNHAKDKTIMSSETQFNQNLTETVNTVANEDTVNGIFVCKNESKFRKKRHRRKDKNRQIDRSTTSSESVKTVVTQVTERIIAATRESEHPHTETSHIQNRVMNITNKL